MSAASNQEIIASMDNAAHMLISREEFGQMLAKSPRWQAILEDLIDRAYEDLKDGKIELSNDILLSTVVGVRGQDAGSVKLFHLNFLVKEIQSVESGNG